ncbi:MAG: hypothetical protein JKY34_07725 [Kordiimonadaceae bacterium]|nr:hypothetical protein [Kordiimonadaceae bacterium]
MSHISHDSWSKRRRIIHGALAVCALSILIGALKPDLDPGVAQTLITQAFWAGSAVIGSYVFGAVWEDRSRKNAG